MAAGTDNNRFERIEKKFMMTRQQYEALLPVLDEHMAQDAYGETLIWNVYCDTPDYALIRRSVERPRFKEKFRLRSYGVPDGSRPIYAEIKRKLNGIGYKRRISVPFEDALRLLRGEAICSDRPQIENEILAFVRRYRPEPRVCLTYRRYAMTGKDDPDFRMTIDWDTRYRTERPGAPDAEDMMPVLPDNSQVLMEVKALGAIPRWLLEAMNRLAIRQAPFSKIGTCYTLHIARDLKNMLSANANETERKNDPC